MLQSNIVLLSTAAVVLGAGVAVGRLSDRLLPQIESQKQQQTVVEPQRSHSWPWDQLGLSAQQRAQMDSIWTQTRQEIDATLKHRGDMETQREAAIMNLLTPEQKADYEKINADYRAQRETLFDSRNKLVQDANDQSRALLDADQQKKWDAMTKEMRDRGGMPGGPGGRGHNGGPGMHGPHEHGDNQDRSTTRPSGDADGNHIGADVAVL